MSVARKDVAVVGGGPAGLLAALLIARTGAQTTLIAPAPRPDTRTTALLDGSVAILRDAGVWDVLRPGAAPLLKLRIIDGGRRLFRAPEVTFEAGEIGVEAFGWNVANAALTKALIEALANTPGVRIVTAEVRRSSPAADSVSLTLDDGATLDAALAVAADGRGSLLREAAGIGFKSRRAPQTALAFFVSHDRDHDGVSTEIQAEEGPFTLVPLPGKRSSVVWVASPARADSLLALSPEALAEAATLKSGRLLGAMRLEGAVGSFPITVGVATRFAAARTLLVGESGHVLPPIGAQGLNLGVRDAAGAAKAIATALAERRDVGDGRTLRAYARSRVGDVYSRAAATDLLNRSLLSSLTPVHAARGFGLAALSRIGPLRRFVMREGLAGGPAF
ncbi:UbiH/UbiF family hydroxylase [Hansschlegelia plantiphila]|uniref:2-octaprenyl-6-methoxyphenyl hydroxylase n=1 Tax=Hansschlegelia plantiphila TaxID=374655 RepID=A0A9W6J0R2_9HYPH|nr:UbiH/UbiF family hydroxylase [Hansschlegelia plantiphila]GLK68227.1 2-octaprenyl-6-methoxyphenyl hydroxylase [Hansschlegelia plantiphila]